MRLHPLQVWAPHARTTRGHTGRRIISTTAGPAFRQVLGLSSWDADGFREKAFRPKIPARLPRDGNISPLLRNGWFQPVKLGENDQSHWSLNYGLWSDLGATVVPVEFTWSDVHGKWDFRRLQMPLEFFLEWTKRPPSPSERLYIAQCQLTYLPAELKKEIETPAIVLEAGKGDVYNANLWMGLAPTYTPLHRDPNPNLFLQLAGRKVVRLFPPETGASIFANVQEMIGTTSSSVFRGDEMMKGKEREALEREVWQREDADFHGFETELEHGEALFIPLGWWHSIKGVGSGITASLNWWFR